VNDASRSGPRMQDFWPKLNCGQIKLPNFVNPSADSLSKFGHDFRNKWFKTSSYKKVIFAKNVLINKYSLI
jgi:hypothetical protein